MMLVGTICAVLLTPFVVRRSNLAAGLVALAGLLIALLSLLIVELLSRTLFGAPEERWKYLWTRPTYVYYRDTFFEVQPLFAQVIKEQSEVLATFDRS